MVQDGSATGTSPRNLVSLAGIPPIASEDDTPASNQPDILSRLQSTMLLAQADDGTLLGYASGQYLLFIGGTSVTYILSYDIYSSQQLTHVITPSLFRLESFVGMLSGRNKLSDMPT